MQQSFFISANMHKRFAVVKLWPDLKTAEDECIARLKLAAEAIGVECVEIYSDGRLIENPSESISRHNVDFALHLHFDTPKNYDAFSFVALWNPIAFYHEWGYYRCSRNLVTHDDFISCSSSAANDHVRRMIRGKSTHLSPRFHLYHSTPSIVHTPSLGDGKLFYAGINWDALRGGRSRHQEMLRQLDTTGLLRIYGPTIFQGVKVWDGYQSYVKEVPFDGISMINEIAKAGISLVLSSQAHKESELMSNRLFESIAAGALVICDENQFAKKYFGDALLYIDTRGSTEKTVEHILRHLEWAQKNSAEALQKIEKAQEIFRDRFNLISNLSDLYANLDQRKGDIRIAQSGSANAETFRVQLNMLMPTFSEKILVTHLASISSQDYENFEPVLWVGDSALKQHRNEIERLVATFGVQLKIIEAVFADTPEGSSVAYPRKLGRIIYDIVQNAASQDALVIVAPNERLFSNHLSVLAGALQRDASVNCAATAAILDTGAETIHSISELIDFGHVDKSNPPGYGRFIFRTFSLPGDLDLALPYLHGRSLAVMCGGNTIDQQLLATVTIDLSEEFPLRTWKDEVEDEVIRSYSSAALAPAFGMMPVSSPVSMLPIAAPSRMHLLLQRDWWKAQLWALRRHGVRARLGAIKRKMFG